MRLATRRRSRILLVTLVPVAVAAATLGLGASGSSASVASKSSFNPAPFLKIVESAAAPTTFPKLPASPPIAKNKFIVHVSAALSASGNAIINKNIVAATKALGWKELTIDTKSDPAKIVSSFQQAESLHPDAIVITSLPAEQSRGPIAAARKLGIPVFCVACGFLKSDVNPPKTGLTYEVIWSFGKQGAITAADIVLQSKGTAHILMTSDPEFSSTRARNAAALAVFKQCAGCKVSRTITFNAADSGTTLPSEIKAALEADPSINYVWNPYEDPATAANQAIQQLGSKNIFTTGVDANAPNVASIVAGGPQFADNVVPLQWAAYAEIDNVNRYFAHKPMLLNNHLPYVLLTKANAKAWENFKTGSVDIPAGYDRLWGVK